MSGLPGASALRRFAADDRGAAAIEFALVSIPLITLTVGMVDFGRTLYTRNGIAHAADIGARSILLDNSASATLVETTVRDAFIAGDGAGLAVTLGTTTESGVTFRTIRIEKEISLLTPFIATNGLTLRHDRRVPID